MEDLGRHLLFQKFLKQTTNQSNWFQLWGDVSLGLDILRQADRANF